jgi:aminoglycoside 6'-N-acetyltransferase
MDSLITLRPLADADAAALLAIHRTPEVLARWDEPAEGFPWDDPQATRFVIEADGVIAGMIQFGEELEPQYRHAWIDLFVDPSMHGRGIGTQAVRELARLLFADHGHHRITIDPAADNLAAIRTYTKVGFRTVGLMREYERDADGVGWHDGLLMELLASDFAADVASG